MTKPKTIAEEATNDVFVPDRVMRRELGNIGHMTVWRHDRDPAMAKLGWPPVILFGGRKYRSRKALELFKANLVKRAIAERGGC
jgi:hypothetical protein